jgi:hypothetical protein
MALFQLFASTHVAANEILLPLIAALSSRFFGALANRIESQMAGL